jgi:hypothetical protein
VRRFFGLVMVLFGSATAAGARAQGPPDSATARAMAETALQGRAGEAFLRPGDLAIATAGIMALHRRFPETRGIGPAPSGVPELELADSAWRLLEAGRSPGAGSSYIVTRTGLPGVDSVNTLLGVREMRVERSLRRIVPLLTKPANLEVVAELYRRLREVRATHPPLYFGVEQAMTLRLDENSLEINLWRGWGDCMSGCLHTHAWTYRYDVHTRRVRRVSDTGDPITGATF